eukprot:TRINITY_DN12316_c0_g1_i2.p1 TRINITY_DN12316_c0_g1~~TRINITY_DN12316_c0_g1_i2.p1  ORF type:complete len:562 (-),score=99.42 TRINITY_DN12316_c0_g1_i2:379-2064(-)
MALSLFLSALLLIGLVPVARSFKPNILFILADDLGYNEMGFMNTSRGLHTPVLDGLASSGVILKNYYVQPICSPTRSAFMTGRYTVRLGTQSNVIYWNTPWGVPLNETFLPQNLQDAGYATAMFGKWHLGMFKQSYTPIRRGFDEHMGYYQGCESKYTHVAACCTAGSPDHDNEYVCHDQMQYEGYDWFKSGVGQNTSLPDPTANQTSSAELIGDAAVEFLQRQSNGDRPWFLYLPFQNIHGPYTTTPEYRGLFNSSEFSEGEKTIFGYIAEMDAAVGRVMNQLTSVPDMYQNTVIVFSSDNGAPNAGPDVDHDHGKNPGWIARNYPFRGHKGLIWEGGTRVPGFVHSPLLPVSVKGTVSQELYHVTDWLPTLVGLAGGTTHRNLALDGHDIWNSLIEREQRSPRTEMLYNVNPIDGGQAGTPRAGLRVGDYKVLCWSYTVAGIAGANTTGPCSPCPAAKGYDPELAKGPVLYNLADDPGETTNLATRHPEVLKRMLARLAELADGSVEPQQWVPPYQGESYYCKDCPLHPNGTGVGEPWSPWCADNGESRENPCGPVWSD